MLSVRVARPSILLGAMPLIARWYRQQQRGGAAALPRVAGVGPATMIRLIARTEQGTRFLLDSIAQLESDALKASDRADSAHSLATAAALAWAVGALERAHGNAHAALSAYSGQDDADSTCELHSLIRRVERQMRAVELARACAPSRCPVPIGQVDRVRAGELSVRDFLVRYALPRRPCVFVGLGAEVVRDSPVTWTVHDWQRMLATPTPTPAAARFCEAVSAAPARLKVRIDESSEWARLEDAQAPATRLRDAVAHASEPGNAAYLFDYSLALNCPQLLVGLRVPKYFASDLLQSCAPEGALYRETWPSLFIGPRGTSCALHVDTFGSHFWCALLDGVKRWAFFPEGQLGGLGVDFSLSQDGSFAGRADELVDALHAAPLQSLEREGVACEWAATAGLTPLVCELGPGDALFVPAGMPHGVRNVEGPALSLSANYVDCTNLRSALEEIELAALTDERALALLAQLRAGGCRAAQPLPAYEIGEHVPFADYKRGDASADGRWPALELAAMVLEADSSAGAVRAEQPDLATAQETLRPPRTPLPLAHQATQQSANHAL
jgi:hypothetical protein